jgi:hypothetical protein
MIFWVVCLQRQHCGLSHFRSLGLYWLRFPADSRTNLAVVLFPRFFFLCSPVFLSPCRYHDGTFREVEMWLADQMPLFTGKFTFIYFVGFSLKRVTFCSKIYSNPNTYCFILIFFRTLYLCLPTYSLSFQITLALPSVPGSG